MKLVDKVQVIALSCFLAGGIIAITHGWNSSGQDAPAVCPWVVASSLFGIWFLLATWCMMQAVISSKPDRVLRSLSRSRSGTEGSE